MLRALVLSFIACLAVESLAAEPAGEWRYQCRCGARCGCQARQTNGLRACPCRPGGNVKVFIPAKAQLKSQIEVPAAPAESSDYSLAVRDAEGRELKVGDRVTVEFEVAEVHPGERVRNVQLNLIEPLTGRHTYHALRCESRLALKKVPAERATQAARPQAAPVVNRPQASAPVGNRQPQRNVFLRSRSR